VAGFCSGVDTFWHALPSPWPMHQKRPRKLVKRFFNKIEHFGAIAPRYRESPLNFLAAVKIIAAKIWINAL
jgi:hypothetical protein